MANWIEQQLCIRGGKDSIEKFKNSFISLYESYYSFDFDRLFGTYEYVLSRTYLEENHSGEKFDDVLILEEHSPNFDFSYDGITKYYEFIEKKRFNPSSWVEPGYHTQDMLVISDDEIIIRFTSKWSPVIQAIIETSKQYPDLYFRLAFYDCVNPEVPDCCGCVEGQMGIFKDSVHDYGFYHMESIKMNKEQLNYELENISTPIDVYSVKGQELLEFLTGLDQMHKHYKTIFQLDFNGNVFSYSKEKDDFQKDFYLNNCNSIIGFPDFDYHYHLELCFQAEDIAEESFKDVFEDE